MVKPNDTITDGTVEWTVRDLRGGTDGNPVGTILAFAGNGALPDGYLMCDGAAVSRTDYADLFAVIGTIYGAGNGSTTFNLPNTITRFLEGNNVAVGYIPPGLPNIWGHIYNGLLDMAGADGAFIHSVSSYSSGGGSGNVPKITGILDASYLGGLYGRSTTVQPSSIGVRFIIKY